MNRKLKITGIVAALVLVGGGATYVYTAPYPGNTGWQRTPGVRLGGTLTPAPDDFTPLNEVGVNLIMKLAGFPPFAVYLSYVGTPDGVITATRPDGGYWAQRVRDDAGDGWLRIGDQTFAMRATEVLGDARIPMLEAYSARTDGSSRRRPGPAARLGGLPLEEALGAAP